MRLSFLIYIVMFSGLWVACSDEDSIVAREPQGFECRFSFPQGDNEWDKIAEEVYEKYGIYLIYKDVDSLQLNASWTPSGGYSASVYSAVPLNDEQANFQVKFMRDHVFAYVPSDLLRKIIPPYYYLLNTYNYSGNYNTIVNYTDGFDFWVSSIFNKSNTQIPTTKDKLKEFRVRNFNTILQKGVTMERIKIPNTFSEGLDFKVDASGIDTVNWKRGFLPSIGADAYSFGYFSGYSKVTLTPLFISYLFATIRYTEAEFLALYKKEKYPLLHNKRRLVIDYMKEKYGFDLEAICEGPEI